jgi:hypothetical protein
MAKKKKKKHDEVVNGIPVDSIGEVYFAWYFQELKDAGYVKEYKRGQSYLLSESLVNNYVVQLKTKSKPSQETILMGHSYNLDYEVEWTEEGANLFCSRFGEKIIKPFVCNSQNKSFFECKPMFDFNNMTRLATLNVKWLYQKFGIYVQFITPEKVFPKTFTPQQMLKTKTGKDRKINFKVTSLENYVNLQYEKNVS